MKPASRGSEEAGKSDGGGQTPAVQRRGLGDGVPARLGSVRVSFPSSFFPSVDGG
ncbi:proline-rich receptor-like protein kinase PERK9 [Iris pallida]|uniref:Proline-rich receptor-like protein kinase PERK9 n=1 Tax=Iris pallida TaxID=29817 RepID=A0AAX6DYQ2_IRIPA|nr:proline-rich receptor-like protein kinase PERK9 [Iris pallida]